MSRGFTKGYCLNQEKQIIINLCFSENSITFFTQNIYKSPNGFKKAMRDLCKGGLMKESMTIIQGKFVNKYTLTLDGLAFAEILRGYINAKQRA